MRWGPSSPSQLLIRPPRRILNNRVAKSHVYRSADYGATWTPLSYFADNNVIVAGFNPSPHSKDHLIFVDVASRQLHISQDEGVTFTAVSVVFTARNLDYAPEDDRIVCAVDTETTYLHCSSDWGRTWAPVALANAPLRVDALEWGVPGAGEDDARTAYALAATPTGGRAL